MVQRTSLAQKAIDGFPDDAGVNITAENPKDIGPCPPRQSQAVQKVWETLRYEWRYLLSEQDRTSFLRYCKLHVRLDKAERKLDREGMYDYNGQGRPILSATYLAWRDLSDRVFKAHISFGATPSTRGRVTGGPGGTTVRMTAAEARKGGLAVLRGGKL